jgi:membrane protein YqaA with SNARE-associated domain
MRRLYDWMMEQARSARATHALFWVSFIESSFFPIPPDVMLIPMVIAERLKAWYYATIATVGSVIGGVFGYLIGYFFFEQIGRPILEFYGKAESFGEFTSWFNEWGVWILIIKGMTPFPYKVLTITAGVTHMPIVEFVLASIVARAMRFYLVAGLLYFFGAPIRDFIERRLNLVTTVFVILLVLGFVAIRYVF